MIMDALKANDSTLPSTFIVEKLRSEFPEFFNKEGDFKEEEFLKVLRKSETDFSQESYRLEFVGKSYAEYITGLQTETVIVPDTAHNSTSLNRDSENVYIVGDNLDALKHLRSSYRDTIKCIYIDPPYNTGKDAFVYNDSYNYEVDSLIEKVGLSEEEARRTVDLNGKATHSAWLSFMLPRIQLAKDLLTRDGILFISIDDNELSNLTLLCDSLLGEQNHLGTIVWKNATDNNPTQVAIEHEYVLVYAKNVEFVKTEWKNPVTEIKDALVAVGHELIEKYDDPVERQAEYTKWYRENKQFLGDLERYKYIDAGGIYIGSQSVHNPGKEGYRYDVTHPITNKPTRQPLMGYRFPESTMQKLLEEDRIIFGKDENKIVELKVYAHEYQEKLPSVIELDGRIGANELRQLFDQHKVFTNPKPVALIERLLSFILHDGDTVLDFFSGSATTAHAVLSLNARDNGSRKHISVQLPEDVDSSNLKDAAKLGLETIDEIGRARIGRAASKIKTETGAKIDYGFKLFRLSPAPINSITELDTFTPDPDLYDTLHGYVDRMTIGDTPGQEVILSTLMNRFGHGLTPNLAHVNLKTYSLPVVEKTAFISNEGFTQQDFQALITMVENERLELQRIVALHYAIGFSVMHTIKSGITNMRNSRNIELVEVF